ncbi:hypothetical protein VE01_05424, partial [Pseudogymnoascus verrucosus]
MPPLDAPAAQQRRRILFVRRRMIPPRLFLSYLNYILIIIFVILFGNILYFLYSAPHCDEHSGLLCWNTPSRVTDLDIIGINAGGVSGRDIPPP